MRKPFIIRLANRVREAFARSRLRVEISFRKGNMRIDAQSATAIAAAVLIIAMVVPRNSDEAPQTYNMPPRESVIWLAR